MRVELPLDNLKELWPEKLRGARIAALLHPASVSAKLEHASHILERHNGDLFQIAAFFGPQHGFLGQTQDNMVEWQSYDHSRLRIPVYSLYGERREPSADMLHDVDVQVVVLDRPNPINGVATEGPVLNAEYTSFVGMHPIQVRHGRTIGELARQF